MNFSKLPVLIYLFIALSGLVGCSQIPVIKIKESLIPADESKAGYIAGSMSKQLRGDDKSPFGHNWIYLRKVGDKEGITLSMSHNGISDTPPDYSDKNTILATFRIPLVPGDYEIYGVKFYYNNGQREQTFSNREEFSVPIEIKNGITSYIGAFTAKGLWGENILGMGIPVGGYFVVEDKSENDLSIILSKQTEFDITEVEVSIPDFPEDIGVIKNNN